MKGLEAAGGFKGSLLPNVAFWNQKKISRKAPGRWPKDMLLGRQGRHEGFRGSSGRRGGFKGSLLPSVAFWDQKKISRKAPGRWPKDMPLGRQGRHEGFRGSWGRRGGFKGSYCLTLLSETRRKPPEKRENLQESARQVAKGHAARPPRAPWRV